MSYRQGGHIIWKAFLLYPLSRNRQFHTEKDKAVKKTLMRAYIHPVRRGADISVWRGVDCLFLCGRLAMPLAR